METSLKLSSQQEELKSHAYLQMRLFYSRPWHSPHFPWIMINSRPGFGVRTALGAINPNIQSLDALQWNVLGGKGTPTLHQIGQWSSQARSTLVIRNLHLLDPLSRENPWYRAVIGEIFNLLQGCLGDCMEKEAMDATVRNAFIVGVGDWTLDEQGNIATDHKYHAHSGLVLENNPEEYTVIQHLLGAFHSHPFTMHAPTEQEWVQILQAPTFKLGASLIRTQARKMADRKESFHKLGEILADHLMDTHVPELTFTPAPIHSSPVAASDDANHKVKFIRSRVRLLLCKLYGEVNSAKLKQALSHTLQTLEDEQGMQKSIDELLQLSERLNKGDYKTISAESRTYLLKQLSTASLILTKGGIA